MWDVTDIAGKPDVNMAATLGTNALGITAIYDGTYPNQNRITNMYVIRKGLVTSPYSVEAFYIDNDSGWIKILSEISMTGLYTIGGAGYFYDSSGRPGMNWFPLEALDGVYRKYTISGIVLGVGTGRPPRMDYTCTIQTGPAVITLPELAPLLRKTDIMGSLPNIENYDYSTILTSGSIVPSHWDSKYPTETPTTRDWTPTKLVSMPPILVPIMDTIGKTRWVSSGGPKIILENLPVHTVTNPTPIVHNTNRSILQKLIDFFRNLLHL